MSTRTLSLPRTQFDAALRRLLATPHEGAVYPLGLARTGAATVFLARAPDWRPLSDATTWAAPDDIGVLAVSSSPAELATHYAARLQSRDPHVRVIVVVGAGVSRGQVVGLVRTPAGSVVPLDGLDLPGSGMYRFTLDTRSRAPLLPQPMDLDRHMHAAVAGRDAVPVDAWDRTRRALGDAPWHRLTALRYGVVGCGRTGSLAATHLVRLGATSLCLVDDDRLAVINLGETDGVTHTDALNDQLKVDALASGLRAILGTRDAQIDRVAASVTSMRALAALRTCDVIVVCADNGAARLASAHIAATYHKVLLDCGTGVLDVPGVNEPRTGFDVRLITPGSACLHCLGGVANTEDAWAMLRSADVEHRRRGRPIEHQEGRRGSLRSLNMAAVGLGMRLLEDLVAERVRDSTWLHLQQDADGGPPVLHATVGHGSATCAGCATAGHGDVGLGAGRWAHGR